MLGLMTKPDQIEAQHLLIAFARNNKAEFEPPEGARAALLKEFLSLAEKGGLQVRHNEDGSSRVGTHRGVVIVFTDESGFGIVTPDRKHAPQPAIVWNPIEQQLEGGRSKRIRCLA